MNGAIFNLAYKSVTNRLFTVGLTVLAIAMSVTLFLGVDKIRTGARESFSTTISGTDLIVGARSGSINLLLYSVFRIGDPTGAMSWESYEQIAGASGVEWAVPHLRAQASVRTKDGDLEGVAVIGVDDATLIGASVVSNVSGDHLASPPQTS